MPVRTRGDIKQQILDRLGAEAATEPRTVRVIEDAINGAYTTICGLFEWWWFRTEVTLPIVAGTYRVPLPDGATVLDVNGNIAPLIVNVFHAELVSTGAPLGHMDPKLDSVFYGSLAMQSPGQPERWGRYGSSLYLQPPPGANDQVHLFVEAAATPFTGDNQEPLIPLPFRQILVEEVMATIFSVDGVDMAKQARARNNSDRILAGMVMRQTGENPAYKQLPAFHI